MFEHVQINIVMETKTQLKSAKELDKIHATTQHRTLYDLNNLPITLYDMFTLNLSI